MKSKNSIHFLILLLSCLTLFGCASEYKFYIRTGSRSYHEQNYQDAIERFTKAIQLKPSKKVAYYNRGQVHYKEGKYNLAINDYTKVLEIDPDHLDAYVNRAGAFRKLKKFSQAITDYNQAIKIFPKFDGLFCERGVTWKEIGNFEMAIEDLTKAISLNPKGEGAYLYRSEIWYLEKFISDLSMILKIEPNNTEVLNALAWIMATSEDAKYRNGKKAVLLVQKAIKIKSVVQALDTLAAAYAESGRFKEAIKTQKKVIKLCVKEKIGPKLLAQVTEHLEYYKLGKPWRQSCKKIDKN